MLSIRKEVSLRFCLQTGQTLPKLHKHCGLSQTRILETEPHTFLKPEHKYFQISRDYIGLDWIADYCKFSEESKNAASPAGI